MLLGCFHLNSHKVLVIVYGVEQGRDVSIVPGIASLTGLYYHALAEACSDFLGGVCANL